MFTQHHATALPGRRARRRLLGLGAGVLAVVAIGAAQFSLALFTDQESVDATFASGSVELDGAAIDQLAISLDPMMPGDSITDGVVVENVGSGDLRYVLTTASSNADAKGLRDVLQLTVKTIDATTPLTPCNDFDGTTVMAAAALGASGAGFGDSSEGDDTGDRTLVAGASETLCFRVQLPLATTSTYEGATTTTTFTFAAEQTANNP